MASTTFVNNVTLTDDDWFNDVDALVYDVFNEKIAAGTSGTILRSNGTNIVNTTATYPTTTTANRILYSTGTNAIGESANLTYDGTTFTVTSTTSATHLVTSSTASVNVGLTVSSTNATSGTATITAAVTGVATDASYVASTGGPVVARWGLDASDSSKWKLTFGAALGTTDALTIDPNNNLVLGTAALATGATNGFFYVDSCAGTPTGVPTTYTGRVPMIFDTTGVKVWFYTGGAWKGVVVA